MSKVQININPLVLRWAREEAGYETAEIAGKVDIAPDRYLLWEKEGKNIPLGKLKLLANTFRRQLAVFLLPEVPAKISIPHDFRNLGQANSKLSKKVLEVMRDVSYFRETALEMQGAGYWKDRYTWLEEVRNEPDTRPEEKLREILDINIEEQLSWPTENEAYRNWRQAVEDRLGILVFQFSMPLEEIHGFCLTDNMPYAIVTNSNHSYTARIFTIFHELAHILNHQSGMCLFENATANQEIEWAFNKFAGRFLIPGQYVYSTDKLNEIKSFANKLKISREVYLRRQKEENKISSPAFFSLLEEIKATYPRQKKKSGFVLPEAKSRADL
jgi:Zn-dependent peptidase ImmA (M78 family)